MSDDDVATRSFAAHSSRRPPSGTFTLLVRNNTSYKEISSRPSRYKIYKGVLRLLTEKNLWRTGVALQGTSLQIIYFAKAKVEDLLEDL